MLTLSRASVISYVAILTLGMSLAGCGSKKSKRNPNAEAEPNGDGQNADGSADQNQSDGGDGSTPAGGDGDGQNPPATGGDEGTGNSGGEGGGEGSAEGNGEGGGEGSGDGTVMPSLPPPAELVGKWASNCVLLLDGEDQNSFISESSFQADGTFTASFREFFDGACADKNRTTTINGKAVVRGPVATPAGATAIDYTVTSITLTPDSPGAKVTLKNAKFCGYTNWVIGEAKDVTGKECKKPVNDTEVIIRFNAAGEVVQDIFKIDGNKMNIGIEFNESGTGLVTTRPTALIDVVYTKVP